MNGFGGLNARVRDTSTLQARACRVGEVSVLFNAGDIGAELGQASAASTRRSSTSQVRTWLSTMLLRASSTLKDITALQAQYLGAEA